MKGGDIYDKKRNFSIYHNITIISSNFYITFNIKKASDSSLSDGLDA